jgi:hypothetical protein
MILIPSVAKERASAKFVFTHFNTDNGDGINNKLYIFVLGLLMSQYTLTGYDASAHMVSCFVLFISSNKITAFRSRKKHVNLDLSEKFQTFCWIKKDPTSIKWTAVLITRS